MFSRIIAAVRFFSPFERKLFFASLFVFFVVLLVLILNLYFFGTEILPDEGGSFTEGVVGQLGSINPVVAGTNEIDQDLIELLFADLLTLSKSYERNEDGSEWSVELKRGVFWSDGEVLDIEDVLFTINLIQNRELASPLASSWKGVEVLRESDTKLRFILVSPYRYFENTLRNLRPIPEHIFSSVSLSTIRLNSFALSPVTSGPYSFAGVERGKNGSISNYKMRVNKGYAGEKPFIEKFEFKFFERFKDAVAAFNRGFIDGLGGFDSQSAEDIRIAHELYALDIPRYYAIFINQDSDKALREDAVRFILSEALNRDRLREMIFGNYGESLFGPIPSYIEGYDEKIYENAGRSSRASLLSSLEDAGWELNKESGIREKDGEVLSLDLIVPDIGFLRDSAFEIQEQLKELGIEISPIILSPAAISSEIIKSRDYELILFGNILRGTPDIFSFWHSSQRFSPGLNLSLYQNDSVDTALEVSRSSFDDERSLSALARVQKEILEDNPAIFLYAPSYLYAINPRIMGFEEKVLSASSERFADVESWHLKKRRVLK